jgi:hypothetical protein
MREAISHTLKKEGEECNHENQENTDNAVVNPVKDRMKVIASPLSIERLASARVSTYREL